MKIDICSAEYSVLPEMVTEIANAIGAVDMKKDNLEIKKDVRYLLIRKFGMKEGSQKHTFFCSDVSVFLIVASTQATVSKYILEAMATDIENVIVVMPNPTNYWTGSDYTRTVGVLKRLTLKGIIEKNVVAISNFDECVHFCMGERIRYICRQEFQSSFEFGEKLLKELPALRMEDSYKMVPIEKGGSTGAHFEFVAVDDNGDICPLWNHLTVENNVQGVWQAVLLTFARAWMPLFWHALYIAHNYILSANDLKISNIEAYKKFKDKNIYPLVSLKDSKATVSYCYWTEWGGLIRKTENLEIDDHGHILYLTNCKKNEEVLYAYDCGLCL